jgi:DNA-directed RNA polymerase specialized sigma24 family protein
VRGDSAFEEIDSNGPGIEQVSGRERSPAEIAELNEEYRRILDELGDDVLRRVACWKVEGRTNDEIAERLECSVATVERKVALIRDIWRDRNGRAGSRDRPARNV